LLSLFKAISGGDDWGNIMAPLVTCLENSRLMEGIFTFYIFFMVFGVLNVVVGTFVETAADVARRDQDAIIENQLAQVREYAKNIRAFFYQADKDRSGFLSFSEFEHHLSDERVKAYFNSLDLDVSQAKLLFQLLDSDQGGAIAIDEFIGGCMRLKGEARSIDVNLLLYQNDNLISKVERLCDKIALKVDKLEQRVGIKTEVPEALYLTETGAEGPAKRKFAENAWTGESVAKTKSIAKKASLFRSTKTTPS